MGKRILAAYFFIALSGGGAFATLMLGASGALYMDTRLSASEISSQFKSGDNIWYGGFLEGADSHLGFGLSLNTSEPYYDPASALDWSNIDGALYFSYHLFGSRAFLDPIGELGYGALATYSNSSRVFTSGTQYWYAALGLGINLGPIGVFGKFAYDFKIKKHLRFRDEARNWHDVPFYQAGEAWEEGYMPNFRFTLGAKLIF